MSTTLAITCSALCIIGAVMRHLGMGEGSLLIWVAGIIIAGRLLFKWVEGE